MLTLEQLETRSLLSSIVEYPIPTTGSEPLGITAGPDNAVWFTEFGGNNIGRITSTGAVTEYPLTTPNSAPVGIVTGSDGALWFAQSGGSPTGIGRITVGGALSEYKPVNAVPANVTLGPDGNVWLTGRLNQTIQSISLAGVLTTYSTPTASVSSYGITTGSDGQLWFTLSGPGTDEIQRYDPVPHNSMFTTYTIPTANAGVRGITAGPDGALWFTEYNSNKIGRLATNGTFTEYTIPTANSGPIGITAGPDGALWFAESNANQIGRITTSGVITELAIPTANSGPENITAGPNNTLWFTEYNGNQIGEIELGSTLTATPATINATEGSLFQGDVASFTDSASTGEASDYSATISWGDGTTTAGTISFAGGNTYDVSGAHTYAEQGSWPVTVSVQASAGGSASADETAQVADAPLSANGVLISSVEGSAFNGTVATFTDGNPGASASDFSATITWGDGSSSAGTVSFDSTNDVWDVSGSNTYAEAGTYPVSVTINDVGGSAGGASSSATVADAALSASAMNFAATEGESSSGVVATFTDANPDALASDFSATITWGDGTSSAGTVTFDSTNDVWDVSGTTTYAEAGTYPVAIAINDIGGSTAAASATATVADAALAAAGMNITATEGTSFSGIVATFTDANPDALATDFSATITWGDGTSSAGTVSFDSTNDVWDVSGSNTYAEAGTYPVSVNINDVGASTAVASATATIADAALSASGVNIGATEGTSFSGVVATFTDANPDASASDFSAAITWGDGTSSAGTITFDSTNDVWDVSRSNTYAEAGTYPVSVNINDVGGSTAAASASATIADAALAASGVNIAATEGTSFSGLVATFTDANPDALASDFSATITWGDGTSSPGTISFDSTNDVWDVSGSNTYAEAGSYPVSVTINDVGGSTAAASASATIADAALAASGINIASTAGTNFSGVVATFSDANPDASASDFSATITWGDGTSSAGMIAFDKTNGVWDVSGSKTYAEAGSYPVSVAINDVGGSTAAASATATIADAALAASGVDIAAIEGTTFSGVVATFTDANPDASAADFSATITWGDGTSSAGTITFDSTNGVWDVSGTNTYAEADAYPLSVTINDVGGSTAAASATATVADAALSASGVNVTATEGTSFSGVVATFTDANLDATASDFSATITWGDGASSAGTISFDSTNGVWDVSGVTTYAQEGSYTITVTIDDVGGASSAASSTAMVSDAEIVASGLPVTATKASPFSGLIATFTDANPRATAADFTVTITWGDGQSSPGRVGYNTIDRVFTVSGSNTYAEDGVYAVRVTVRDSGGATATVGTLAVVSDASNPGTPNSGGGATVPPANPGAGPSGSSTGTDSGDGSTTIGGIVPVQSQPPKAIALGPYVTSSAPSQNPAPPAPPPSAQASATSTGLPLPAQGSSNSAATPTAVSAHSSEPPGLEASASTPKAPPVAQDASANLHGPVQIAAASMGPSAIATNAVSGPTFAAVQAGATAVQGVSHSPQGEALRVEVLYDALDELAKEMDGGWFQPETVVAASALVFSAGYVVWSYQTWYFIAGILTARPLWKAFDPLSILDRLDEKTAKAKGKSRKRLGRGSSNPLSTLLPQGPHRKRADKASRRGTPS